MSAETRKQTRDRLMAEGRWGEFVSRREALKKEGKSPAEAHALAHEEFQPVGGEKVVAARVEAVSPKKKRRVTMRRVMSWVFENMDAAAPTGAPSKGAKALHKLVAANEERKWEFCRDYIRLFVPKTDQEEDEYKADKGGRLSEGLLERWLENNKELM